MSMGHNRAALIGALVALGGLGAMPAAQQPGGMVIKASTGDRGGEPQLRVGGNIGQAARRQFASSGYGWGYRPSYRKNTGNTVAGDKRRARKARNVARAKGRR